MFNQSTTVANTSVEYTTVKNLVDEDSNVILVASISTIILVILVIVIVIVSIFMKRRLNQNNTGNPNTNNKENENEYQNETDDAQVDYQYINADDLEVNTLLTS